MATTFTKPTHETLDSRSCMPLDGRATGWICFAAMPEARTFAELPPARTRCRVSVAIPARDESDCIAATLEAFVAQREPGGQELDPDLYEVVVFANDCSDDTAALVRQFAEAHPRFALYVAEAPLPRLERHIGFARRTAMNAAAERLRHLRGRGIVASTDADTSVSPEWIARTISTLRGVDAVGGRVLPERLDDPQSPVARAYALEHRYQYAVVRIETLLDPRSHDPWPRHANHQGASFALREEAYTRVGGTPAVPVLEDFALYDALMRAGIHFRHSLRVRVTTSGRRTSRVQGGYASHHKAIDEHVAGRAIHLVENPSDTLAIYRGRGALRRGETGTAAAIYGLARDTVARLLREATTIGVAIENIEREAQATAGLRGRPRVAIELGIRALELYRFSLSASTARPTRINASSGAG